jgi:hypothetical protein
MASFEEKEVLKGDWRLIAESVTAGNIVKIDDHIIYRYKGVPTGAEPPKTTDRGLSWSTHTLDIGSETGEIDVYIKCPNQDGLVEVML